MAATTFLRHRAGATALVWLSPGVVIACLALVHRYYARKDPIGDDDERYRRNIEAHMLRTQKPARLLSIRASAYNATSLTLTAPLSLNRNVHGTAFAGSLYSVAVLASYYLAREWLQRFANDIDPSYIIVARAGSIRYMKPVTSNRFEAKSKIPEGSMLQRFLQDLTQNRKAIMSVDGEILQRGNEVACRYSIEVCAYYGK